MRSVIDKLAAYGGAYTLRFKVWRNLSAQLRGTATRFELNRCGKGLRVHGAVMVERDAGSTVELGDGVNIEEGVRIHAIRGRADAPGAHVTVGDGTILKRGAMLHAKSARMVIGKRCAIGRQCELSCADVDLTIGDGVRIATGVWIGTGNHNFSDVERPIVDQGVSQQAVTIGDDVWLGAHAVVVPGVTVGRGCVVAAGAVVTRDVPDFAIVGGVPAKVLRRRGPSTDAQPPIGADPTGREGP